MRVRSVLFTVVATLGVFATATALAPAARAGGGPTPIVVDTPNDVVNGGDGLTSLREAVTVANNDGGSSQIVLGTAVTYQLTICGGSGQEDGNLDGDLDHLPGHPLDIVGNGSTVEQTCADERVIDNATGALTVDDTVVTGGDALLNGGGIESAGSVTLESTHIVGNEAANDGGGVWTLLALAVNDTVVEANHAPAGNGGGASGGAGGPVTVTDSAFLTNSAQNGGGLNATGTATITNTTFAENTGELAAGAVLAGGALELDHATLVDGFGPSTLRTFSGLTAFASVVEKGSVSTCVVTGGTVSEGFNIESSTTCGFNQGSDQTAVADLGLGPARDNGSPPTAYPLNGSPAVDTVAPASCDALLPADQRGVTRPFGGGCDSGATEAVYPPHGFSDVALWMEDGVRWITSGVNQPPLMVGFGDSTFRGTEDLSRGQAVRMLYRLAGEPPGPFPAHGFSDVPAWIETPVRWAKATNVMTGYPDSTFRPDDPVTRAQLTRMNHRAAGSPPTGSLDPHGFSDVPLWVETAVTWAAHDWDGAGPGVPLMNGFPDGTFKPNDSIVRGAVARKEYRLAITPAAWAVPANAPATVPFVQP